MPKSRKTIRVRIPEYVHPRLKWRRRLQKCIRQEQKQSDVVFGPSDRLEVLVRLYLRSPALEKHDLDNRLKDILDALQGRLGGSKAIRPRNPTIPNDNQIWRIVAEKSPPPSQSQGLGHLTIKKLTGPSS